MRVQDMNVGDVGYVTPYAISNVQGQVLINKLASVDEHPSTISPIKIRIFSEFQAEVFGRTLLTRWLQPTHPPEHGALVGWIVEDQQ